MNNIDVNKLDMQSKDIVNDNVDKIFKLFPNCISEGKFDFDMLKPIIKDINNMIDIADLNGEANIYLVMNNYYYILAESLSL